MVLKGSSLDMFGPFASPDHSALIHFERQEDAAVAASIRRKLFWIVHRAASPSFEENQCCHVDDSFKHWLLLVETLGSWWLGRVEMGGTWSMRRRTENPLGKQATIHTTMGDIVVKLFHQDGKRGCFALPSFKWNVVCKRQILILSVFLVAKAKKWTQQTQAEKVVLAKRSSLH